jgi:xanthine/CO dehydrogenase XdhC/CoxF family maturation factor
VAHEVPWGANFVLWLRRKSVGAGMSEPDWFEWIERVISTGEGPYPNVVAETAPNENMRALCLSSWATFVREWEPRRRALEAQIAVLAQDPEVGRRVRSVMGKSNHQLTLLQTDEAGTMCRKAGDALILGDACLVPETFCAVVEHLVTVSRGKRASAR